MSELASVIVVECPCCHRSEHWSGSNHQVDMEGGHRQPAGHPHIAAWNTLRRSLAGEIGRVVGACVACGQPLVTTSNQANLYTWTFPMADGEYAVAGGIEGPDGPVSPEAFQQRIMDEFYEEEEFEPAHTLFSMTVLLFMTAPVLLWVVTGIIVAFILFNYSADTQVFVPSF